MDRDDLAAQLSRLTRRLGAAERPLLEVHGLSMWSYIALSRLASRPADTQLELAGAMGYDKTRLIRLLDSLEGEGLVTRDPDPADRRARVVRLTAMGAQRHAAARDAIRAMEATFLEPLPPDDRESFLAALARLVDTAPPIAADHPQSPREGSSRSRRSPIAGGADTMPRR